MKIDLVHFFDENLHTLQDLIQGFQVTINPFRSQHRH